MTMDESILKPPVDAKGRRWAAWRRERGWKGCDRMRAVDERGGAEVQRLRIHDDAGGWRTRWAALAWTWGHGRAGDAGASGMRLYSNKRQAMDACEAFLRLGGLRQTPEQWSAAGGSC